MLVIGLILNSVVLVNLCLYSSISIQMAWSKTHLQGSLKSIYQARVRVLTLKIQLMGTMWPVMATS